MNGRYQTFSGPMSRQQKLANALQQRGSMDNFTPTQDMQYSPNPMTMAPAQPQFGRVFPKTPLSQPKPKSPGMTTPRGGSYRGDFENAD
jgi:hypothetical protein